MPRSQNPLQPSRSSPLSTLKRTKPGSRNAATLRLDDVGAISSLPPEGVRQDIVSLIEYIKEHRFEALPERAGMNSTQISTTLRFRTTLPPIVSLAHLYALSSSPTSTERELARLVARGVIRKVSIPGRGKGGTAIGDGIVLVADWEDCVRSCSLSDELKDKYIELMKSKSTSLSTRTDNFSSAEIRALVTSGCLTTPAALTASLGDLFKAPTTSSLLNVSSAGSSAPTGTFAAIGGIGAVHENGGSGSMLATSSTRAAPNARQNELQAREMTFSLPNTGAYLKLLASARTHLIFLLRQMSPKWKEGTIDLLKEKWNGSLGNAEVGEKKRVRGESSGLLVGRTRKWREFMGLEFDYVLAEALGSGVVEIFDTGSVGPAVRLR
ncbi:hypothetical protein AMS68_002309 [Peltaster fructicola]|uniref:Serine-threonine protein kinase 19 n=1 Tax=Peltaster fructicola TaxID=286661 RepID=A0A6H0XPV1_9PEZI|nr:hypothetical protein AMS68_002309 [Peltaster fructicola]